MHLPAGTSQLSGPLDVSRKQSTSGTQKQDDPLDEFDDEEKFLNLDDILRGQCAIVSFRVGGLHTKIPGCESHKRPPMDVKKWVMARRGYWDRYGGGNQQSA